MQALDAIHKIDVLKTKPADVDKTALNKCEHAAYTLFCSLDDAEANIQQHIRLPKAS